MYICLDDLLIIYPVLLSKVEGDLHTAQLVCARHQAIYHVRTEFSGGEQIWNACTASALTELADNFR